MSLDFNDQEKLSEIGSSVECPRFRSHSALGDKGRATCGFASEASALSAELQAHCNAPSNRSVSRSGVHDWKISERMNTTHARSIRGRGLNFRPRVNRPGWPADS